MFIARADLYSNLSPAKPHAPVTYNYLEHVLGVHNLLIAIKAYKGKKTLRRMIASICSVLCSVSYSRHVLPLINCYHFTPYSVLNVLLYVNCSCFHLYSYPDLQHAICSRTFHSSRPRMCCCVLLSRLILAFKVNLNPLQTQHAQLKSKGNIDIVRVRFVTDVRDISGTQGSQLADVYCLNFCKG